MQRSIDIIKDDHSLYTHLNVYIFVQILKSISATNHYLSLLSIKFFISLSFVSNNFLSINFNLYSEIIV